MRLVQRSTSGRSYLLGSQVQSYGLGISLAFVTLLLGAAVLTLERDENVLARLLRSGARPALLVAEKVALCAIVGAVLGLLLALGFGVAAEISSSGAAWARIPLLVVPLAAAGAAFGALGCVVGAAARDLRASSLVGVALVTPIVLVGLVPRTVSPLAAGDLGVPAVRARRARVRRDAVRRRAAHRRARARAVTWLLLTAALERRSRWRSSGACRADDDAAARLGRERARPARPGAMRRDACGDRLGLRRRAPTGACSGPRPRACSRRHRGRAAAPACGRRAA